MKLLDIINPTDYREMAQNSMDESRIPVWMINAETDLEDGSNLQIVISQPKENVFAGLNRGVDTSVRSNNPDGTDKVYASTDQGHAFLMMGPDSITGAENGFLNIAPDLGSVAGGFGGGFMPLGSPAGQLAGLKGVDANGNDVMSDLLSAFTVDGFTVARDPATMVAIDANSDGISDSATLNQLSQQFVEMQVGKATYYWMAGADMTLGTADDPDMTDATVQADLATYQQGLQTMGFQDLNFSASVVGMACSNPQMGNMGGQLKCTASTDPSYLADVQSDYATVLMDANGNTMGTLGDLFTGADTLNGFGAMYGSNLASFGDGDQNSAFEYMTDTGFRTFDTFVNARSQYVYNMPSDSDLDVAFRVKRSLDNGLNYSLNYSYNYDKNPIINLSWKNDAGETLTQTTVSAPLNMMTPNGPVTMNGSYIELRDSSYDATTGAGVYGGGTGQSAILTFEQSVERAHNVGTALDYAVDTEGLGAIVLRGEFLYQKDVYQPVMALSKLALGDLVGALQMKEADRFKYVLGADITVLTNMMVSAQFIQDRNLDHVDDATGYTTDYATMHLSNGFNKAEENKEFYSLFFSKPFGGEQQHRWNNIFMYEENGGKWNRFDVEYSFNDELIGLFEYDKYWGDENTQFGQLENSSNLQLGLKYIF